MSHTISASETVVALQHDNVELHKKLTYLQNNPMDYPKDQREAIADYQSQIQNNEFLINNL